MRDPVWGSPAAFEPDGGLLGELRERVRALDVAVLGAVPSLLAVVFVGLDGTPDQLVLSYAEPTPASAVTAHFVHRSLGHLVANLATYGFVVPTGYALAVLSGRRREYAVASAGFLLVLPPVLSGLDLLVFDRGISQGFSGVTMAFVGMLPVFLGSFDARRLLGDRGSDVGPGLFFLGLGFIAARSVPAVATRRAVVLASLLIALVYLRGSLPSNPSLGGLRAFLWRQDGQLAIVAVSVFLVGLAVGFPLDQSGYPVVVNTYGHLLGYSFGFVVPYVTFRALGTSSALEEVSSEPS